MDNKDQFKLAWKSFCRDLKDRLSSTLSADDASCELANKSLNNCKNDWGFEHKTCGKWLLDLYDSDIRKAAEISKIISMMRFEEVYSDNKMIYKNSKKTATGCLLFGLLGYFFDGAIAEDIKNDNILENLINQYVNQLDLYKNQILVVLE